MTEPLVWTTRGNLPAADLRYETAWQDGPEFVVFRERHYLGDELVRESAHVLKREGSGGAAAAGDLGGGRPAGTNSLYVF